jgi:protoporphyrinogen oxidase
MSVEEFDVVILGAGPCGLAAATQLGDHAVVIERAPEAGGLVRTHRLGEWWFDEVLHLLYFWDPETARLVRGLLGDDLAECRSRAWVRCPEGVTRYPFQMHLGSLPAELAARCVADAEASARANDGGAQAVNFQDVLLRGFGAAICETFLFPYNRKVWKRPLDSLAPSDFQWNIPAPDLAEIRRGAADPERHWAAYNDAGFYPRPAADAPVRGMQMLSQALAARVPRLYAQHEVVEIDLPRKRVQVRGPDGARTFGWRTACLSTIPLPATMRLAHAQVDGLESLAWNRVVMVDIAVEGPRPVDPGHWCYYADEGLCFNRLVYMHEFDPLTAPARGWGLMAEITEPAERPLGDLREYTERALADARRAGALRPEDRVVTARARCIDHAYVAFTLATSGVAQRARELLRHHDLTSLGRYGGWQYSSMSQVMRDGFSWGRRVADRLGYHAPAEVRWAAQPAPATEP